MTEQCVTLQLVLTSTNVHAGWDEILAKTQTVAPVRV